MSTWTSSGVAALLCLVACVPGLPEFASSSSQAMRVMGGAVTVAPVRGYCVDRQASRETDTQAIVIMGRCSDASGVPPAVVTVAIGAPGSAGTLAAGAPALAAYFASEAGRAALSRDGKAGSVRLRDVRMSGDRLILHLDDAATGETWRSLFGVAGRLVSISVSGTTVQATPGTAGRSLLDRSAAALIRANSGTL